MNAQTLEEINASLDGLSGAEEELESYVIDLSDRLCDLKEGSAEYDNARHLIDSLENARALIEEAIEDVRSALTFVSVED